jgi:hypothetical protein
MDADVSDENDIEKRYKIGSNYRISSRVSTMATTAMITSVR